MSSKWRSETQIFSGNRVLTLLSNEVLLLATGSCPSEKLACRIFDSYSRNLDILH